MFFLKKNRKNSRGIAIFLVLGLVAVMSVLAIFVSKMSSGQRRQVVKGVAMTQIDYLIQSAMEVVKVKAVKEAKSWPAYFGSTTKANTPMYLFKQPMAKGTEVNDNNDRELVMPSVSEINYDTSAINLKYIADRMNSTINSLQAKLKLEKAFSYESNTGKKVVGHDVTPWMRELTKRYVNQGEIKQFDIDLPEFKLVDLLKFNLVELIVNNLIPGIDLDIDSNTNSLLSAMASKLDINIGKIFEGITGIELPSIAFNEIFNFLFGSIVSFPIEIKLNPMPLIPWGDMWPGIPRPSSDGSVNETWVSEKYGIANLYVEGTITSSDDITLVRTGESDIEFRVSDCQPLAPLYGFFLRNPDDQLGEYDDKGNNHVFNCGNPGIVATNLTGPGRRLFVNNLTFDFFKKFATGITGFTTIDDPNICDIPGLIRVNGQGPYIVNLSWFGVPKNATGDELKRIFREHSILMLDYSKYRLKAEGSSLLTIFGKALGGLASAAIDGIGSEAGMFASIKNNLSEIVRGSTDNNWIWPPGFTPAMSDWNNMVSPILIPNPFHRGNTTHLFGEYSLSPTLWREVEGNVRKNFTKWTLWLITGLWSVPKLIPGVGGTSFWVPIPAPPIPIPIFWAGNADPTEPESKYVYSGQNIVKTMKGNIYNPPAGFTAASGNTPFSPAEGPEGVYGDTGPIVIDGPASDKDVPNLFTEEQYAKKANYYFRDTEAFEAAFPRFINSDGYFMADGVIFVDCPADSISGIELNFPPLSHGEPIKIKGIGMLVTPAAINVNYNIVQGDWDSNYKYPVDSPENIELRRNTKFSILSLEGFIKFSGGQTRVVESSVYAKLGIQCESLYSKIYGNLILDYFDGGRIARELVVNYRSTRTRVSLFSTQSDVGKYDPRRNVLSLGNWSNIKYGTK